MKVDKNRKVKVVNRSSGSLAYKIESLGIVRHWLRPEDYLNISIAELLELKTAPGGMTILREHVVIDDVEALHLIFEGEEIEPEYTYGQAEVDHLLQKADVNQLLDALDFAPKGVLEMIRLSAIETLPNETAKVAAINEKFGLDLNRAHELFGEKDDAEIVEAPKRRRRTKAVVETEDTGLPTYNVLERERMEE